VKQTKPYGKAYASPASSAASAAGAETVETPVSGAVDIVLPDDEDSRSFDLYDSVGQGQAVAARPAAASWRVWLRQLATYSAVLVGLAAVYVLMRDSVVLANMLQELTTEETVMVCKDGKVLYDGYNPLDRLFGRGHLICTDWQTQRGFLSSPLRR